MRRRDFITNAALVVIGSNFFKPSYLSNASFTSSDVPGTGDQFSLNETTISALQEQLKSGKLTSEAITKLYLKRIAEIDKSGPAVNAVIELNPDAISIARRLDEERKA